MIHHRKITVAIADDDLLIADIFTRTLTRFGFLVVGVAANGQDLMKIVKRMRPAVVITDLVMPKCDGVEACRVILRDHPSIRVILLTGHRFGNHVPEALELGVHGILFKMEALDILKEAISEVLNNRRYLSPDVRQLILETATHLNSQYRLQQLSAEQRELLKLISIGCSNKESAALLGIPTRTGESRRLKLMRDLNLHNTALLVLFAVAHNIVNAESALAAYKPSNVPKEK